MYCMNCGNEVSDASKFCRFCGSGLAAAVPAAPVGSDDAVEVQPVDPSAGYSFAQPFEAMKEQARFSHELSRLYQEKRDAEESAALCELEHERLISRSRTLRVLAIVFALSAFGVFYDVYSENPSNYSEPTTVVAMGMGCSVMLALIAFMPYGLAVVKDFVDKRGYVIWAAWVFLLALFGFVLAFAMLAGIPAFFTLKSKIKKTGALEGQYRARACAIQRQIESM